MIDCADVSYSVSAVPTQNAMKYSAQIDLAPAATATTSTSISVPRTQFAPSIARRRSSRSASIPAGSANSSHGSVNANASPAISTGERVYPIATSGSATFTIPSDMSDSPAASHIRQ